MNSQTLQNEIDSYLQTQFRANQRSTNQMRARRDFESGATIVTSRPFLLNLETTTYCNLKCVMCEHGNNAMRTKSHLDDQIVSRMRPFLEFAEFMQIFGLGEPLLSPAFWKLLSVIVPRSGLEISINSNGILLTSERIDALLASPLTEINISLDAATPETYQKIRGGDFNQIIENIRMLVDRRNSLSASRLRILMNMTMMRTNIRELPDFVDLAADLGVDKIFFWHLHDIEKNHGWKTLKGDWKFDYEQQLLKHDRDLANAQITLAVNRAQLRNIPILKDGNKSLYV